MQFDSSFDINQSYYLLFQDCSGRTQEMIFKLPDDEKVHIAVKRIIDGQWVYFTSEHARLQSPFKLSLCNRVITELKQQGYQIIERKEMDNYSSIDGKRITSFLGTYVFLKY